MYALTRRLSIVLGLILGIGASGAAFAEDAKPVRLKTFKRSKRQLDEGVKGVKYSSKTYKYSRSTKVKLKEDHTLVLTVWSAEFQPTIKVRKSGKSRILMHGKYDERNADNPDWNVTRVEFTPEDRGVFIVTISTKGIDQGTYYLEGAIWGFEKPKPVADDADAPSAAESSTAGFEHKPYEPRQNKRRHYRGGAYNRGGKFAAEVGVTWLEGGDTSDSLGSPTDAKNAFGKVDRRDGNVFYFEPETTGSGAKKTIRSYKIMIFHPTKELHVLIRVKAKHASAISAFVKKGQALFDKYDSKARPQS